MSDTATAAAPAAALTHHNIEFRGQGGEFFRIWIVNIVLTVLTLGIYSAWAKVRTSRYFYGSTYLAGHPFDYHASPVRILIGRMIAIGLLLGYSISVSIKPWLAGLWSLFFLFAMPWLVVSSLRFAARNSSYRNVRFNFVGTMGQAAKAYILWPVLTVLTIGIIAPLARRVRDYFYINNHTFGGKPFHTKFEGIQIYAIYFLGFGLSVVAFMIIGGIVVAMLAAAGIDINNMKPGAPAPKIPPGFILLAFILYIFAILTMTAIYQIMQTMIFNLAVRNTVLDGRHKLTSTVPPMRVFWIAVTNVLLLVITLGFYYPWARVRLARVTLEHMGIDAATDLDEFTSEAIATQGAVGEEIAGFFDLGIGL